MMAAIVGAYLQPVLASSAVDVAAWVAVGLCAVALVVFIVVIVRLLRTLRVLGGLVDDLRREAVPMVVDLRQTVRQAGDDLDRVEGLLDKAETIATTVDAASRLTYRALRPPLVRSMALVAGARRAGQRLRVGRRRPVGQPPSRRRRR